MYNDNSYSETIFGTGNFDVLKNIGTMWQLRGEIQITPGARRQGFSNISIPLQINRY
jgi:hypothetical protein